MNKEQEKCICEKAGYDKHCLACKVTGRCLCGIPNKINIGLPQEESIDTMLRDFCSVVPKSKSEVRRRIENLLSLQARELQEKIEKILNQKIIKEESYEETIKQDVSSLLSSYIINKEERE